VQVEVAAAGMRKREREREREKERQRDVERLTERERERERERKRDRDNERKMHTQTYRQSDTYLQVQSAAAGTSKTRRQTLRQALNGLLRFNCLTREVLLLLYHDSTYKSSSEVFPKKQ